MGLFRKLSPAWARGGRPTPPPGLSILLRTQLRSGKTLPAGTFKYFVYPGFGAIWFDALEHDAPVVLGTPKYSKNVVPRGIRALQKGA